MNNRDQLLAQIGIEQKVDSYAEQAVLGAALLDAEAFEKAAALLQGEEFDNAGHACLFRTMQQLRQEGYPLDLVTVTARLQDTAKLDFIGGVGYLGQLAAAVPTTANIVYYASRVKQLYAGRQAVNTAFQLLKNAGASGDADHFIAQAEAAVSDLSELIVSDKNFVALRHVLLQTWEEAEGRFNSQESHRGVIGIASGFDDLDRITSGFQKGGLIIVAARPAVGKTVFALNVARHASIQAGESVAFFSLEMSATQLVQRLICAEGQVDAGRMRTGRFVADDWERMAMAIGRLSQANLFIDDTPGITVNDICYRSRRLHKEQKLGLLIVDYLQLIQGSGRRSATRQEEVSQISRTLKQLARELDIPIIALSQLSRGVEQRQDKRPLMSDLRESGAIEQDADIVAFLYRDDYYHKETDKKNRIEIIVAKQRNGPVGTVELAFLKAFSKFADLNSVRLESPSQSASEGKEGRIIPDMYRKQKSGGW